jgi:hypothetical protein
MAIFYSYVCLPEGTPNEFPTQNWQLEEDIWKISKKYLGSIPLLQGEARQL